MAKSFISEVYLQNNGLFWNDHLGGIMIVL
jgi:hypothetical protein